MALPEVVAVLKSSPYFQGVNDTYLTLLASVVQERRYEDGEVLIAEGAPRMESFYVVEGSVERARMIGGEKCVYEVVEAGKSFGILHSLREDPCYSTCTAKGRVRAFAMSSEALHSLLDNDPGLGKAFTYALAKTVQSYNKLVRRPTSNRPRLVLYDSKEYWHQEFDRANTELNLGYDIKYVPELLTPDSASYAEGATAVVCFVNDDTGTLALRRVHAVGCKMVSMRCAGYDRVDLHAARALDMLVTRVPEYSPFAVAEHAMGLAMAVNRRLCRAYNRTREHDFKLEGLLGMDLNGRTAGVLGTGRIGQIFINICRGFGMRVVCYDKYPNAALKASGTVEYKDTVEEVLREADLLSLHIPLLPETRHLINAANIAKMKRGVLIINCGRGLLVDTKALIEGLSTGHVGGAGLDVYENETEFFFTDHSDKLIQDPVLQQLLQFNNVILTAHQAFFTSDGLRQIARVSLDNVRLYLEGRSREDHPNAVRLPPAAAP